MSRTKPRSWGEMGGGCPCTDVGPEAAGLQIKIPGEGISLLPRKEAAVAGVAHYNPPNVEAAPCLKSRVRIWLSWPN